MGAGVTVRHVVDSNRYHERKAAGLCVNCGIREAEGTVRCLVCADRLNSMRQGRRHGIRTYAGGRDAPAVLEDIGAALGITRERARQIQAAALNRFCQRMAALGWSHEDALMGLAILGVRSMEQSGGGRPVERGRHYASTRR